MSSASKSNELGLPVILFLIFLVLKLTNCINWSWWLVAAPIWAPFVLMIVAALILGVIREIQKH